MTTPSTIGEFWMISYLLVKGASNRGHQVPVGSVTKRNRFNA